LRIGKSALHNSGLQGGDSYKNEMDFKDSLGRWPGNPSGFGSEHWFNLIEPKSSKYTTLPPPILVLKRRGEPSHGAKMLINPIIIRCFSIEWVEPSI